MTGVVRLDESGMPQRPNSLLAFALLGATSVDDIPVDDICQMSAQDPFCLLLG